MVQQQNTQMGILPSGTVMAWKCNYAWKKQVKICKYICVIFPKWQARETPFKLLNGFGWKHSGKQQGDYQNWAGAIQDEELCDCSKHEADLKHSSEYGTEATLMKQNFVVVFWKFAIVSPDFSWAS